MRNRLELEVLIYYGFEGEDELVQSGKKKKDTCDLKEVLHQGRCEKLVRCSVIFAA